MSDPTTMRAQIDLVPEHHRPPALAAFAVAFTGTPAAKAAIAAAVDLLESNVRTEEPDLDDAIGDLCLSRWTAGVALIWPLLHPPQRQRLLHALENLQGAPMDGEIHENPEDTVDRYTPTEVALLVIDLIDHLPIDGHMPVLATLYPLLIVAGRVLGEHWVDPLARLAACSPVIVDDPVLMEAIDARSGYARDDILRTLVHTLARHHDWDAAWATVARIERDEMRWLLRAKLLTLVDGPARGLLVQTLLDHPDSLQPGQYANESLQRAETAARIVAWGLPAPHHMALLARAIDLYAVAAAQQEAQTRLAAERQVAREAKAARAALTEA